MLKSKNISVLKEDLSDDVKARVSTIIGDPSCVGNAAISQKYHVGKTSESYEATILKMENHNFKVIYLHKDGDESEEEADQHELSLAEVITDIVTGDLTVFAL